MKLNSYVVEMNVFVEYSLDGRVNSIIVPIVGEMLEENGYNAVATFCDLIKNNNNYAKQKIRSSILQKKDWFFWIDVESIEDFLKIDILKVIKVLKCEW